VSLLDKKRLKYVVVHIKRVVLDAMGVIYQAGDDVVELLHPFIVEKGGADDLQRIMAVYLDASLGRITAAAFWRAVGIDPALEDEYLERHRLNRGLLTFLRSAHHDGLDLWCLSNDVSEWSSKLRKMFGLDRYFNGFVISGDAGLRKPDPAIYKALLERTGGRAQDTIFVDDQVRNLNSAAEQGIVTVLLDPLAAAEKVNEHRVVKSFSELGRFIM
jgi:HAD superfamily hydrolase (TIGR01509 family)